MEAAAIRNRKGGRAVRTIDSIHAKVRRVRWRFALLVFVIAACVLISRAHILSVGRSSELAFPEYAGHQIAPANIQVDPPGMVGVESAWTDDEGVPHVLFSAGEPGKGMVTVSFQDTGGSFEMQSTPGGVVVANGFDVMGWEYICTSLIIVSACIGLLCLSAAFSLGCLAWYGYEMAAYAGGALFFCMQAVQFALLFMGGSFSQFSDFALAVTMMTSSFVDVMAISIALLALFVSASNVVLLRREGRAFTNVLGVIATVLFAGAFFGLKALREALAATAMNPIVYVLVDSSLSAVLAYGVALFLGVCATAVLAARHVPEPPRDYLVVLGCALRSDGTPTPLLAGRVDAALAYAERQQKAGFDAPAFVPSGGQGADEACSEAQSMARYITERDPDARVLLEDRSTTTRENMAFSARVIEQDACGAETRVAFATTNYHVLRGYVFAHMAGMDAEGIAAPTRLYFWPNAFLREFVGMLAARAAAIAANCAAIVTLYGVLEYLLLTR